MGVLGNDYPLESYTGPGTTWAIEMYFVMNHAPGAGSILWKLLPDDIRNKATLTGFKYALKKFLFRKAFHTND